MDQSFRIWDAQAPEEAAQWRCCWETWPASDVHYRPEYVRLFCRPGDRALAASWSGPQGTILFPFILRDLALESFWGPDRPAARDLVSPYGYGGAVAWGPEGHAAAPMFWSAFDQWARGEKVVSEFVRFSLSTEALTSYPGVVNENRQVVIRDLRPPFEEILQECARNVRYNVRKARQAGLAVEIDRTGARVEEFFGIYQHTMERVNADAAYFFPLDFFHALDAGLAGRFAYFHVLDGGRVVSSELVLLSADVAHSFLGGTEQEALSRGANHLLKIEVIRWAAAEGKRWLVLGGGYRPEDNLLRFKQGFAPNGRVPFRVGQRILDREACAELIAARREFAQRNGGTWEPRPDFFPPYRA